MKIAIKSFIFLAYILLAFPYQIHSSTHILNYDKEIKKIRVIANKVMRCESPDGGHDHWGDLNYSHPAYGIAQFQKRTFYWLANISGNKNFQWKNKEHQIKLLHWALINGHENLWTCYRWYKKGLI